jgi:hypothetical protein
MVGGGGGGGELADLGLAVRRGFAAEARARSAAFGVGPWLDADVARFRRAVAKAAQAAGASAEQVNGILYDEAGGERVASAPARREAPGYKVLPHVLTSAALGLRELAARAAHDPDGAPEVRGLALPAEADAVALGLAEVAASYEALSKDEGFRRWASPPEVPAAMGGFALERPITYEMDIGERAEIRANNAALRAGEVLRG